MDGLTAAASGLLADERLQQVIMNNISNSSTPGFKQSTGEAMSFPMQLVDRLSGSQSQNATPIGVMENGVVFQESVSNFSAGLITKTGQPFDLAISDPPETGTSVYASVPGTGTRGGSAPKMVSTLSFVVGRGGVIETTQGDPLLPVNAQGVPMLDARIVKNPRFTGLDLFGENGIPVVDAHGQPSYEIVGKNGKLITQADGQPAGFLRMTSSATGGVHSFFPVLNVDTNGRLRVALTRDGQFQVGADHLLYNSTGQRVLAQSPTGQPIIDSAIRINPAYTGTSYFGPNGQPLIDQNGQASYTVVNTSGQVLARAQLGVVATDVNALQPLGITDFVLTPASTLQVSRGTIESGALESSNTNSTQNMINMLNIYRSYAANQKMAQTMDTTLQQTAQLGSVPGL